MLVHRTKAKKVIWEFDSIIMQNMSLNFLLFCVPTWPSYHVIENHLYRGIRICGEKIEKKILVNPGKSKMDINEADLYKWGSGGTKLSELIRDSFIIDRMF